MARGQTQSHRQSWQPTNKPSWLWPTSWANTAVTHVPGALAPTGKGAVALLTVQSTLAGAHPRNLRPETVELRKKQHESVIQIAWASFLS